MLRIIGFWLLCLPVFADDIAIFPGATEFERSSFQDKRFDLAVGGMQKKNGVWQPEYTRRVAVSGQRITFEIGRGIDLDEVYDYYLSYFKPLVVKQLFGCEALDCGSSAQWANSYFGVRELYGADTSQRLAVWLLNEEPQQVVTFYLVQRGNKRVYAHFDIFTLVAALQSGQRVAKLIQDVFEITELQTDELRDLAKLIRENQQDGYNIVLVGHSYQAANRESNQTAAMDLAHKLQQRLQLLGVADLQLESLGMLAPVGEIPSDRVAVIGLVQ